MIAVSGDAAIWCRDEWLPMQINRNWWHDFVMRASEVRLIRGRMRFGGSTINAPFPSCVVVFRQGDHTPIFSAIDRILDPGQENSI